jgi:hypothetical protein
MNFYSNPDGFTQIITFKALAHLRSHNYDNNTKSHWSHFLCILSRKINHINNSSQTTRPIFNHASFPALYKSRNLAHNFVTVIGLHHPDYQRVMVVYWKEQAIDVSVMDGDESQPKLEDSV